MFLTDLPKRSKTSQLHHRVFLFYRSELNTSAIQYGRWWGCGKTWLMALTTANMAHQCANVIMLALMQCILNLIVHNLPSLTVRNNLWLCDLGTSPCASHWHSPTTPHVQCILLTISCSWRTCPRGQRHLSSITGSFSSIGLNCTHLPSNTAGDEAVARCGSCRWQLPARLTNVLMSSCWHSCSASWI